jgi:hypothetical protein
LGGRGLFRISEVLARLRLLLEQHLAGVDPDAAGVAAARRAHRFQHRSALSPVVHRGEADRDDDLSRRVIGEDPDARGCRYRKRDREKYWSNPDAARAVAREKYWRDPEARRIYMRNYLAARRAAAAGTKT